MFTDKVNKFFVISEVLWITVMILRKKIKKYNNPILPSLGRSNAFFLVLFSCLDTQNGTASESLALLIRNRSGKLNHLLIDSSLHRLFKDKHSKRAGKRRLIRDPI